MTNQIIQWHRNGTEIELQICNWFEMWWIELAAVLQYGGHCMIDRGVIGKTVSYITWNSPWQIQNDRLAAIFLNYLNLLILIDINMKSGVCSYTIQLTHVYKIQYVKCIIWKGKIKGCLISIGQCLHSFSMRHRQVKGWFKIWLLVSML